MSVRSEYQPLIRVIVHRPDYEWNMITVGNNMPERFLIEDVLFTEHAAADHSEFTDCLRYATSDETVLEFTDLLCEILTDREVRSDVAGAVSAIEGVGLGTHDFLLSNDLSPNDLAKLLIAGAFRPDDPAYKEYRVFFPPIPNLLFTRDLGMFIGDSVILSHPAKTVRRREGLLARYIFRNHHFFKDIDIIDILDDATVHGLPELISLEGGDLILRDHETLLIGCSERTTDLAIELLAKRMFREGRLKRIIKVEMPIERATMHLDTVFTIVGENDCVYYPPFFGEESSQLCPCVVYVSNGGEVKEVRRTESGLFDALDGVGLGFETRIPCGGELPHYQTREQWTDGANLFAVRPRMAFIYERNIQTIASFKRAGYEVLEPVDFLKRDISDLGPTLVTLSGAELSRGRGGARCMTMPVDRAE